MDINYEKIAEGIYNLMPEEGRMLLRIGVIPKVWMDKATEIFKDVLSNRVANNKNSLYYGMSASVLAGAIKEEVVEDFQSNLAVHLLKKGGEDGRLN